MRLITPQLPEVEMRNSPNVTKDDSERVYIYIIIITLLFWVHGWSSNNNENGSAESAVEWQPSPNTAAWPTSGPWEFIRGAAGNYWFDGNLFIHSTSLFCLLIWEWQAATMKCSSTRWQKLSLAEHLRKSLPSVPASMYGLCTPKQAMV